MPSILKPRRSFLVALTFVLLLAGVPAAEAADGTVLLASGRGINVEDTSADGRYVVFTTNPTIVGGDPITQTIKLLDTHTGVTKTVWSRTGVGTVRVVPRISADGRWVVHGGLGVSVYDRTTGSTAVLDTSSVGGAPRDPVISGDGTTIAFTSLVDNWAAYHANVWTYDRVGAEFTRISGPESDFSEAYNWVSDISRDGRYVAFTAGETGFVHDRVAGTNGSPLPDVRTVLLISGDGSRVAYRVGDDVWARPRAGGSAALIKRDANVMSISDDGRYVVATSWGAGAESGVFVADAEGGSLRLTTETFAGVVSDDGSVVVFSTPEVLTSGATAGVINLYALALDGTSPTGGFLDTTGHNFEADIYWLAGEGITRGCNPPDNTMFCPDQVVTRGQMAAFLSRALDLDGGFPSFSDTVGHVFEADVTTLAGAGITRGCNPPTNDRFCPDQPVTRGQMAAFLHRALPDLAVVGSGVALTDISESVFVADIEWLASTGVTRGCNPPANDRFCPDQPVTRGQMAAFLSRALG